MKSFLYADFTSSTFKRSCLVVKESGGKLTKDKDGLLLESTFKKKTEHVQNLLVIPDTYMLPKPMKNSNKILPRNGDSFSEGTIELFFEAEISCKQEICYDNIPKEMIPRIRNIKEDPRLNCSAVCAFDETTNMNYMFLVTDNQIFALYERKTSDEMHDISSPEGISAFSCVVPLQKRFHSSSLTDKGLGDTARLALSFKSNKTTHQIAITWYVNGEALFSISNIGGRLEEKYNVLDYGGLDKKTGFGQLKFGIGHYSFLDFQLVNNYDRDMVSKDTSGTYPVYRSKSGLVKLESVENYKEPYPNIIGERDRINPLDSFSLQEEPCGCQEMCKSDSLSCIGIKRGMKTRIKYIRVYLEQECKKSDVIIIKEESVKDNPESVSFDEEYKEYEEDCEINDVESGNALTKRSNSNCSKGETIESNMASSSSDITSKPSSSSTSNKTSLFKRISKQQFNMYKSENCDTESESMKHIEVGKCWICKKSCKGACCDGKCGDIGCI
jgi:hypothetical protein